MYNDKPNGECNPIVEYRIIPESETQTAFPYIAFGTNAKFVKVDLL